MKCQVDEMLSETNASIKNQKLLIVFGQSVMLNSKKLLQYVNTLIRAPGDCVLNVRTLMK